MKALETRTIIIADKEPLFLDGLRTGIGRGYQIVGQAASSPEVLSLLSIHQPHLLIVGFRLACGRDALGLAREFRRRSPETAIIVLLPRNSASFTGRLLTAEIRGLLARCSPTDALLAAIRTVLAGEVFADPSLTDTPRYPMTAQLDTSKLSDREREIFHLLGLKKSTKDIAALLSVSAKTVESHLANIKAKLHLSTACDLCSAAKSRVLSESSGVNYVI